ncbi:MAG TPA: AMP-binding protein [Mycobacteriales bacterium]|nr:AMP-binding protein [Mycobacteriales bacterium]
MSAAETVRLVGLALPPGAEFAAALDEAWARGDAVLPLDPAAPPDANARLRRDLTVGEAVAPGTGVVIATSGSTGEAKGVVLTRAALAASARATHDRIGAEPGDRWLSCLPWHHIAGLQVLLRSRLLGLPMVVHERFDVERFAAADATLVSLVPTQLARLLDAGVDWSRFRVVLVGGAAAAPALIDRARAAGVPVVTTYGMSETCGGCVYDGRPLDGVEVDVDADGRIRLRGPMLASGYRGRPDLTAAAFSDGWFRTDDLGRIDDGRLEVLGRADDVVVTGGEKVAPGAVTAVLAGHPGIADVAVAGVPDAEWGQRLVAVVVATAPLELAGIRDWCRDRLPKAAVPQGLVVVDAIPQLPSGKPDRLAIQQLAAGYLRPSAR